MHRVATNLISFPFTSLLPSLFPSFPFLPFSFSVHPSLYSLFPAPSFLPYPFSLFPSRLIFFPISLILYPPGGGEGKATLYAPDWNSRCMHWTRFLGVKSPMFAGWFISNWSTRIITSQTPSYWTYIHTYVGVLQMGPLVVPTRKYSTLCLTLRPFMKLLQTSWPTDGHEGSKGSYTSNYLCIVHTYYLSFGWSWLSSVASIIFQARKL